MISLPVSVAGEFEFPAILLWSRHYMNFQWGTLILVTSLLMVAEVSGRGREYGNLDSIPRISQRTGRKQVGSLAPNEGAASTSGIASQTASGVLSGSGVLNARPGSATSSGLLSQMVSTMNAEVAREYLGKVSDLLEFSQADTTVKSYMCSQSLLSRLFQMFNRMEPPILLKVHKRVLYQLRA